MVKKVKNIIIIAVLLLIVGNQIYSRDCFNFPSNNLTSPHLLLSIDDIENYSSITDQIDEELDGCSKSMKKNAYTELTFERMSEEHIDRLLLSLWQDGYTQYIVSLKFKECPIRSIPESINKFLNLYAIEFDKCDSISSMNGFNIYNKFNFKLSFNNCKINEFPSGVENLAPMILLEIIFPEDFVGFNLDKELSKFSKRKNISELFINYKRLTQFPKSIFNLSSLHTLYFYSDSIKYYPAEFDKLVNLVNIYISTYDDRVEESIRKSDVLHFYSRVNNYAGNKLDKNEFYYFCSDSTIAYDNTIYFMSWRDTPEQKVGLIEIGGNKVQVQVYTANGQRLIKIEFLEAEKDDKLKVVLKDRKNNVLTEVEIKNKIAYVDLSKFEKGIYFLKININYMSKTFKIFRDVSP